MRSTSSHLAFGTTSDTPLDYILKWESEKPQVLFEEPHAVYLKNFDNSSSGGLIDFPRLSCDAASRVIVSR
jgi:hypothetical protein